MKTSNNPACVDLPACFHCWVWACCLNICPNYRAHFISAVLSSQVTCYVCPPPWNRMPFRCPIYVIRSFSAIYLSSWKMNSAWPISPSPPPNSLKVSYFEWAECCLILQTCCCWWVLTVLIQLGNKVKTPKDWVPQAKIKWVAMTPKWPHVCKRPWVYMARWGSNAKLDSQDPKWQCTNLQVIVGKGHSIEQHQRKNIHHSQSLPHSRGSAETPELPFFSHYQGCARTYFVSWIKNHQLMYRIPWNEGVQMGSQTMLLIPYWLNQHFLAYITGSKGKFTLRCKTIDFIVVSKQCWHTGMNCLESPQTQGYKATLLNHYFHAQWHIATCHVATFIILCHSGLRS